MIRRSRLLVLIASALVPACATSETRPATSAAPVNVQVAEAVSAMLPSQIEAGGVLRARNSAIISSRILAPVIRVDVRPGDPVRRGQPLVLLDATELQAHASRAAASLSAARQAGAAAAADTAAAESALVLSRATHARIEKLAAQTSATAQELDQATADLRAAEARLSAARARVTEADAALQAAASAAEAARIASTYALLAAPFDGVIAERRVDPGTTAAPGMPLVVVEEAGPVQLEVRLDAARAATVALQQPAGVRLDTDPADAWRAGKVVEISRIDPDAHSFAVKIAVPSDPTLRTGMFGRARFSGPARSVLSVPVASLIRRGQLAFVYVVAQEVARLRAVSPGVDVDGRTEILDGLSAGETIVVNPAPGLNDGARVHASPAAAPAPSPGEPS